ncbi:MAG: TonB-dependent receptor [Pseudomonadota bacterium]
MYRHALHATTAFGLALVNAAPAAAQDIIDVPAQPLATALAELGRETGLQVLAPADAVSGKTSNAVKGRMTPQAALDAMLADSGLSFRTPENNSAVLSSDDVVAQNATDDGDDESFDLGTLVVEGERVERDVFSTSTSVRVYGSAELEQDVQNTSLEQVIQNTGNVTTIGGSNQTPYIRGNSTSGPNTIQGAFLEGSFPRANLTVDGRIQTFSELSFSQTSVCDVEAVEVFRGPQTTTQGSNSIAGAINVRTKDPVFFTEASARAEVGSFDRLAVCAMVNAPTSDSVALRFVLDYQEQDPFINYPNGIAAGQGVVRNEQLTARMKLLWEPVEVPGLSTKLTLSYTEYNGPQTYLVSAPFSALNSATGDVFPSTFSGNTFAVIHDVSYDFGNGFSVRNQFTYSQSDNVRSTNGGPGPLNADRPLDTTATSNELILDYSPAGSPFSGFLGVFVRRAEDSSPSGSLFVIDGTNRNLGIFGEATYRFGNGFDVTGGVRFEKAKQRRFVEIPPFGIVGPSALNYDASFDAVLPRFVVGYEPNDDLRFAFQVSRGFNPGGVGTSFGAILGIIPLPDPFVPFLEETVTNYELSMRGRFLENRLFVAANLFYSDYDDYQFSVSTVLPTGDIDTIIRNAERVVSYGLEVDAEYQANDRLQIIGSLGLLHSDVKEFRSSVSSLVGNELPFAPSFTASVGLDYAVNDRLSLAAHVRHSAGYYSDLANTPGNKTSSLTTFDLQARYAVSDSAEVYAYVTNVTDEVQGVEIFGGGTTGVTNRPREIGFGVRATW